MKIRIAQLRKIIREVVSASEMPDDGDYHVSVDDLGKIRIDDIVAGGDLATASYDDMGDYDPNGPQPGQPGVWFVDAMGMGHQYKPGDLVRVPEYDAGGSAWAAKKSLSDIEAGKAKAAPKSEFDKQMLKMLSRVTTGGVDMTDIPDFSIRVRKDSIVFNFDPDGDRGITGSITMQDLSGAVKMLGLKGVANWLFDNGASKIKPQRRTPSYSIFD